MGIVAVDLAGQPADYDELRALTDKYGLWLVEDAAAAAGATYKGRPAGSLADALPSVSTAARASPVARVVL